MAAHTTRVGTMQTNRSIELETAFFILDRFSQKRLGMGAYGVDGDRETRPARAPHTPLCPHKVSGPPPVSLPFYFGEVCGGLRNIGLARVPIER